MALIEILKTLRSVFIFAAFFAMLFLRVWLSDQVRQTGEQLERLHIQENKLLSRNHFLDANKKRQQRVDNLSQMARTRLGLVQPVPEAQSIRVTLN